MKIFFELTEFDNFSEGKTASKGEIGSKIDVSRN